jgi:hypothetical protein
MMASNLDAFHSSRPHLDGVIDLGTRQSVGRQEVWKVGNIDQRPSK